MVCKLMKLQSIFLALLMPLMAFGATNTFDNVRINSGLKFLGGTPAVGEILTSDATGNATWLPAAGGGGGDVFRASNNVFSVSNTFLQGITVAGSNSFYNSRSNWFGPENIMVMVAGTGAYTNEMLFYHKANIIVDEDDYSIRVAEDSTFLHAPGSSLRFEVVQSTIGIMTSTLVSFFRDTLINGSLSVTNQTTLGSVAANLLTVNGTSALTPNGLNFNSGVLFIPSSTAGNLTNNSQFVHNNTSIFNTNVIWTTSNLVSAVTTDLPMGDFPVRVIALTNNITFTTSGKISGKALTVRVNGDTVDRTVAFPVGWTFVGANAPVTAFSNKVNMLTIQAFGTADTDIIASWSSQQ